MDSISCNRSRYECRHARDTRAAKIVVLARSYTELRRLIEPLVDHPLLSFRMEESDTEAGAPILLARLPLGDDLLLYLFGAVVPTAPQALQELASGAIGAVIADGAAVRPALALQPALSQLPAVVAAPRVVVPRQLPSWHAPQLLRAQAKQPFTALVRAALAARGVERIEEL